MSRNVNSQDRTKFFQVAVSRPQVNALRASLSESEFERLLALMSNAARSGTARIVVMLLLDFLTWLQRLPLSLSSDPSSESCADQYAKSSYIKSRLLCNANERKTNDRRIYDRHMREK